MNPYIITDCFVSSNTQKKPCSHKKGCRYSNNSNNMAAMRCDQYIYREREIRKGSSEDKY